MNTHSAPTPYLLSRPLVFALVLLATPLLARAQQIERSDDGFTVTVERTLPADPGGLFDLEASNASVTLTGGERTEVSVRETIRFEDHSRSEVEEYLDANPTSYESSGGSVRVRGPEIDRSWSWWGRDGEDVRYRYVVRVPRRFDVHIRTSGGSVEISDLEGTVDGRTAGGSIAATDVTGRVQIQTAGGSVTLRSIAGDATGETAGGDVEAGEVDGTLDLRTAGGEIRVDGAGGRVEARTMGGNIDVEAAEGPVDVRTAGGDILVHGAAQSVEARTAGGDVVLENVGGDVTAETAGGDVEGIDLRGAVEARTTAGDVELRGVGGNVTARTVVGDLEIMSIARSYASSPALDLRTTHGDIELVIPVTLAASIRAEVQGLGPGVDRDEIQSDVALKRTGGDREPLRAEGELNGGGPEIRLTTTGGSIRIQTAAE